MLIHGTTDKTIEGMYPYTTDTSLEAEEMQLDLVRRMPPVERALTMLKITSRLIRECKATLARNHPELTPQEIGIVFIELNYGKELAAAVAIYHAGASPWIAALT